MKIVHFENANERFLGNLTGDLIHVIGALGRELPEDICECIATWNGQPSGNLETAIDLASVNLLPPVPHPEKIICVGRNYADHAAEMGSKVEAIPVIFNKFPTAITGPGSEIELPEISEQVDFEAELVVVIGHEGKNISAGNAMEYVFGYCCGNDVSARDWQKGKPGGQWLPGKTFDSFAPIGPWIVTGDDIDPNQLDISLRLNGELMQSSNTSHLMFKIDYLISHVSKFCTLRPGDLLFTGTPAGVGAGRKPPRFLQPGDFTEVEISGLGKLKNQFVVEAPNQMQG